MAGQDIAITGFIIDRGDGTWAVTDLDGTVTDTINHDGRSVDPNGPKADNPYPEIGERAPDQTIEEARAAEENIGSRLDGFIDRDGTIYDMDGRVVGQTDPLQQVDSGLGVGVYGDGPVTEIGRADSDQVAEAMPMDDYLTRTTINPAHGLPESFVSACAKTGTSLEVEAREASLNSTLDSNATPTYS